MLKLLAFIVWNQSEWDETLVSLCFLVILCLVLGLYSASCMTGNVLPQRHLSRMWATSTGIGHPSLLSSLYEELRTEHSRAPCLQSKPDETISGRPRVSSLVSMWDTGDPVTWTHQLSWASTPKHGSIFESHTAPCVLLRESQHFLRKIYAENEYVSYFSSVDKSCKFTLSE